MHTIRRSRIVPAAVAAAALLIAVPAAVVADTSTTPTTTTGQPVVKLSASISPKKIGKPHGSIGTPVALTVQTDFSATPPGTELFTINRAVVFFPAGAVQNGRLFPSCSARKLTRAHNALSACPKGSKIGAGKGVARAIQLDINAGFKATLFNGPGGHSVVFNFHATVPADINQSFEAPLRRAHGKYGYTLTLVIPRSLQEVLDGVFVGVKTFKVTTQATTTQKIHGRKVKRGYVEAFKCPKSKKAPIHGDFTFMGGATTSSDGQIACR